MTRRGADGLTVAIVLFLTLTTVGPSVAQQSADQRAMRMVDNYVQQLLEPTPDFEQTWAGLNQLVSDECAKVMRATADELEQEQHWLNGIKRDAKKRHEDAMSLVKLVAAVQSTPDGQAAMKAEHYKLVQSKLSDSRMEVAIVALVNARVGQCIETRKRSLGGEYWMTGSWQAKCAAAPGITPETYGRITLQLVGQTVKGTVYPGANTTGAEVSGPLDTYKSFSLRTPEYKSQKVTVSGRFDSTYPLRGSGTIVLGGEVPEHGTWECSGIWKSD